MATARLEECIACSLGEGTSAGVQFEDSQAITGAGVLFLLPALLGQGLLKTIDVYTWQSKVYYSLESIVLTLAFMALLRSKLDLLTRQQQATHLNNILVDYWYSGDSSQDADFLYIDGHVRINYGGQSQPYGKICFQAKTLPERYHRVLGKRCTRDARYDGYGRTN
ncbi:MAG: hypothetical protein V1904_14960 [Bacteroidota bacterium]